MITHKLRFWIHLFVIAVISTYFWTQSRYPDLNRKAMMAKNASVADTISMYPIFEVKATDPLHLKILYTTANWVNDNKKGMTFGVIIGSLFLSLIGYLSLKPSQNKLVSALYGTILGSPLGVCVNCAAPIFKGVLQSKQLEFSFAMMLSSPTLNMIVLTMVFSLFPLYMAITKVLFTLFTIFVVVPLLSQWLSGQVKVQGFEALAQKGPVFSFRLSAVGGMVHETLETLKDFGRAFGFLALRTVPLMFVAGFAGSVVSHAIPFERVGSESGPLAVIIAAAVGLFLPVPMAFDVVLTNALFVGGLAPGLALVLLCTLGIFSSYSFLIVWTSASRQWALLLAGVIFVMGSTVGLMGNALDRIFYLEPNIRDYQAMRPQWTSGGVQTGPVLGATAGSGSQGSENGESSFPDQKLQTSLFREGGDISVWSTPFLPGASATGRFEKHEGVKMGLEKGFVYGIRDYPDPFWIGRGTASGDIDHDGWLDIVFGSDTGPKLYRNTGAAGGGRFVAVPHFLPTMDDKRVYAVALVDWNNDGWVDLFMTTFHRGNYIALNQKGTFGAPQVVPNGEGILTVSPAIADLNGDGWLDVYNGNMALGIITGFRAYGKGRQNTITYQIPMTTATVEKEVDVVDGETMSTIASDVNDDGFVDLYAGNDFIVPDYWFLGQKNGEFTLAPSEGLGGLATPFYSMSIETGDLNNDLKTDYISTGTVQMARGVGTDPIDGRSPFDYTRRNDTKEVCEQKIEQKFYRDNCVLNRNTDHLIPFYKNRNLNIRDCLVLNDQTAKDDCLLSVMWMIVTSNINVTNCQEQFGFDAKILEVCELFVKAGPQKFSAEFTSFAPQNDEPVLYLGQGDGQFKKQDIVHPGGWTWSTKFADFDKDGFLDIFNAEGVVREGGFGFNVLLHNQMGTGGDLRFEQRQFSWNLTDPFYLFSFTLVDYDHDGDLDIVGNSSIGPVQVYENRLNQNSSIAFGLRFTDRNTHGIMSKIIIEDGKGRKQMRELKAGGGYQSFDAARAYFGLGSQPEAVRSVTVLHDGKETIIPGPFPQGAYYEIHFKAGH